MRNRAKLQITCLIILTLVLTSPSFSFDKPTHQDLNEKIAQRTINSFSLDSYLIRELGIKEGVREILIANSDKKEILKWLGYGGFMEDEPEGYLRYPINAARNNNHFHNPLASPWSSAGFDKTIIIPGFLLPLHVFGQSSVLWAQNEAQHLGGKWSWQDARKYFFEALTAVKKVDKDRAMADTFRALGQVMHLIQDASVPAHTRNEIHRPFYHYETWLEKLRTDLQGAQTFQNLIASPIPFDPNILRQTDDPKARVPIANIVDTNSYSGSNPGVTAPPSQGLPALGLSEYTNANFFGESTVFKKFPYPSEKTSVSEGSWVIQDPRDKSRLVQRKY